MIRFIWAQDKNGLIGAGNKLPWSNKEDLNYFKNQTTGGIVVMGLNTWKSIGQKPLKNRINIVLTSRDEIEGYDDENVYIAHSVNEVLDFYEDNYKDLWIIGGATTFDYFRPWCEEIVVSTIEGDYTGDVYFNSMDKYMTERNLIVSMGGNGFTVAHYKVK